VQARFAHVVLTRFNTRHAWIGAAPGLDPGWLQRRLELFEAFCLPSLAAQRAPFTWLVFFDSETPEELRPRIAAYRETVPSFVPVFVEGELTDERIAGFVAERLAPERARHEYLITTRLDTDDAIATDFLARVQRAFRPRELEFLNFPLGYQWADGRFYYHLDPSNPFLSLVERLGEEDGRTIYCAPHDRLGRRVRQLAAPPVWLQVVHGENLRNRVVGIRRPLGRAPSGFVLQVQPGSDSLPARLVDLAATIGRLPATRLRQRRRLAAELAELRSRELTPDHERPESTSRS
jgi:hypothetical protein